MMLLGDAMLLIVLPVWETPLPKEILRPSKVDFISPGKLC